MRKSFHSLSQGQGMVVKIPIINHAVGFSGRQWWAKYNVIKVKQERKIVIFKCKKFHYIIKPPESKLILLLQKITPKI